MKRFSLAILFAAYAALGSANTPLPVTPETLPWISAPGNPGFQFAWVLGAEGRPEKAIARTMSSPLASR